MATRDGLRNGVKMKGGLRAGMMMRDGWREIL